jgi:hypothetical protein
LVNEKEETISVCKYDIPYEIKFSGSNTKLEIESFNGIATFENVDAYSITDRLTVKVLEINSMDAVIATENGYARIITTDDVVSWQSNNDCFYFGYSYSPDTQVGLITGGIVEDWGWYFTLLNIGFDGDFEGGYADSKKKYTENGNHYILHDTSGKSAIYMDKTKKFTLVPKGGAHRRIFRNIFSNFGIGLHISLTDKLFSIDNNTPVWYTSTETDFSFLSEIGVTCVFKHIYISGNYEYIFKNNIHSFNLSVGFAGDTERKELVPLAH